MYITGHRQANPWMYYLIQTFSSTIYSHYNITESAFTFSPKSDSSYPIIPGTLSNYLLVNISISEFTLTEITDTHEYLDGDDFWESDVSYWYGNTSYIRQLQNSTYYEIDIYLTCSVAGSTTITYALTMDDNGTVPSWITLETSDRKLRFTTPELDADTNFTFSIESSVENDANTYANKYYLEVLHSINEQSSDSNDSNDSIYGPTYESTLLTIMAQIVGGTGV